MGDEKLIALYENAADNIEHFKKSSLAILGYYTAIAAYLIHEFTAKDHEKLAWITHENISVLLGIGAIFCAIYVWNNYRLIRQRRWILRRIFEKFGSDFGTLRNGMS